MQSRFVSLILVAAVMSLSGCTASPPSGLTIAHAETLTCYEGLPHSMYEKEAFAAEKSDKPSIELHGYPFYRQTLSLKPDDESSVKAILGDAATYEPFEGEKKCGGFHPDFAVAWTISGKQYDCLICFGCEEMKIFQDGSETRFDIAPAKVERFKRLLASYRSSRPPHERFGLKNGG